MNQRRKNKSGVIITRITFKKLNHTTNIFENKSKILKLSK